MSKELNKEDIRSIVNDEIKKFVKNELDNEISKLYKKNTSNTRKANVEIAKEAISKLAEFLWIRRTVWKNDIK